MKTKCFILVVALTVMICISGGRIVRAGSPASSAGSTTGTATLRGEVKLEGGVPKATPINMAADPSCAKQHPTPVLSQDIVSDAQGGLQNVVVFIADGLGDRTFDAPSQPAVIQQNGCMYQPHVLAVRANQKLDVVNSDTTTHNIHPTPKNNREWNKAQSPHVPIEETFSPSSTGRTSQPRGAEDLRRSHSPLGLPAQLFPGFGPQCSASSRPS